MSALSESLSTWAWQGIEFPGTETRVEWGHDSARHQGYGQRGVDIETTGQKPRAFTVSIPLRGGLRWTGAERLYPETYLRLREALKTPEGYLTHPSYGLVTAHVDTISERIDPMKPDGLDLDVTFTEQRAESQELALTLADANEAVAAFTEGVRTLRQAWGIPDVAVCLEVNVRAPVGAGGEPDTRPEALAAAERDGLTKWVEMRMPVHASWGDAARVPGLLALCLSRAQADHQRRLMELVTGEPSPPETGGDPVLMATYLTQRATAAAELARAATDRAAQFLADAEAAITKLEKLRANRESPAAEKSDPGANPEAQPAVAGGE